MAGNPYWNKTAIAMHMNGADNGTVFTEEKGKTVTSVNAVTKTATKLLGTASGYFNGAAYLSIPYSADVSLVSGDFCIRCAAYFINFSTDRLIASSWDTTAQCWLISVTASDIAFAFRRSDGKTYDATVTAAWTPSLNTFYRIAITRQGSVYRIFVDGSLLATITNANALNNVTRPVYIGAHVASGAIYQYGYIDEFELIKGDPVYTAAYTPSETEFSTSMVRVAGVVKDVNGDFISKPVHVHRQSDGALAGVATSDPTTGEFSIEALDGSEHYVTCIYSNTEPAITKHNIIPV